MNDARGGRVTLGCVMRTLPAVFATLTMLATVAPARAQEAAPPPPPPPAQPLPPLPASPPSSAPTAVPTAETPPPPPPPGAPPPAYAYPPGYYPPPGYGYGYAYPPGAYPPPPPPPAAPAGHHLHDGFFLRMGLGVGAFNDKATVDGASGETTVKGSGLNFELSIGGTLGSGFILGGALLGHSVQAPKVESAGVSGTADGTTLTLSTIGLLGDWYFDPTGGLHAGALIGVSTLDVKLDSASSSGLASEDSGTVGSGIALAPHVGYEGWVGSDWAIGGMFRLLYANLSKESGTITRHDRVLVPTLSFTATFN